MILIWCYYLVSNFTIRQYLNFVYFFNILMMLNKILIRWFAFDVTSKAPVNLIYFILDKRSNYFSEIFCQVFILGFFFLAQWQFLILLRCHCHHWNLQDHCCKERCHNGSENGLSQWFPTTQPGTKGRHH